MFALSFRFDLQHLSAPTPAAFTVSDVAALNGGGISGSWKTCNCDMRRSIAADFQISWGCSTPCSVRSPEDAPYITGASPWGSGEEEEAQAKGQVTCMSPHAQCHQSPCPMLPSEWEALCPPTAPALPAHSAALPAPQEPRRGAEGRPF